MLKVLALLLKFWDCDGLCIGHNCFWIFEVGNDGCEIVTNVQYLLIKLHKFQRKGEKLIKLSIIRKMTIIVCIENKVQLIVAYVMLPYYIFTF